MSFEKTLEKYLHKKKKNPCMRTYQETCLDLNSLFDISILCGCFKKFMKRCLIKNLNTMQ